MMARNLLGAVLLAGIGCAALNRESEERAVRAVMEEQLAAWNEGDLARFLATYWRSDALRFATAGTVRNGWEATRERYENRYGDPAAMGTLDFTIHAVDVFGPETAMVFGAWRLTREAGDLDGLFTVILRKIGGRWVIVHDHTSSGE